MKNFHVIEGLHADVLSLLEGLIAIPSLSGEEAGTADRIARFLEERGVEVCRLKNNVYARNHGFSPDKPTILLNSHHDTVPPAKSYSRSPFSPVRENGRLYGLGSNDAGGPLVALIATFLYFHNADELPFNLILAATAEEETSGENGIASLLPELGPIDLGIVGEPTSLRLAVTEKGLMVLHCVVGGRSGHAARDEGENAIYNAMVDIEWFRTYRFQPESETLGPVKMTVTMIDAGSRHNVVPDECRFTVDVRTTDLWTNDAVLEVVRAHTRSDIRPRSLRLNPSKIDPSHPLVVAAQRLGLDTYGSPTLSDQALMPFATVKIGPGDSARSHTADEWIGIDEVRTGIETYVRLLEELVIGGIV